MHTPKLAATFPVVLALVLSVAPARAETVNCTAITTLPAAITEQGSYCFTGHLSTSITSGIAIEIRASNVILDLNGFKLDGLAAGPGTFAYGIVALNSQNITIKNGTIRGFIRGIWLADTGESLGQVVENIRAEQNPHIGISVEGFGAIVRNNQVVATGGSTILGGDAFGIEVTGQGSRVLNNDVIRTVKQGRGTSLGIFIIAKFGRASGALVVNNRITEADIGIGFFVSSVISSTGKYRDNLTFDVTTPYAGGGTDAGNNN
ncbi:MAG TPA: right-handed parallel beta-helix repeat-containing protein [Candidatus Acidoferrum sp.]|nr:right-handed parallel beta-helix repeat-containing protein [Candidatus Acidoferrum sp.]